jgi:hypothetical protein
MLAQCRTTPWLTGVGVLCFLAILTGLACSRSLRATHPGPLPRLPMAEFWIDRPIESRDLFRGPIEGPRPRIDGIYTLIERKTTGFSPGFELKDAAGVLWNVKTGPEAKPEVVASRLVWAMGYHQLATHYVPRWKTAGAKGAEEQSAGRFRARLAAYHKIDDWSWHENPFVGSRPYKGFLVLMAMLNNSDLKPEQNAMFEVSRPRGDRRRVFIVMDLGHTLGATGIQNAPRGDLLAFEKHGFIKRIDGGRVDFEHRGLRAELFDQITTDDLQWMCRRLARLTDKQWQDAFRAAAYHPTESSRFIARMKAKITQGLRVQPDASRNLPIPRHASRAEDDDCAPRTTAHVAHRQMAKGS